MDPSDPSAAVVSVGGLFDGGDTGEDDLMVDAPEHHRLGSPQPLIDPLAQVMSAHDVPTLHMTDPSPPRALDDVTAPLDVSPPHHQQVPGPMIDPIHHRHDHLKQPPHAVLHMRQPPHLSHHEDAAAPAAAAAAAAAATAAAAAAAAPMMMMPMMAPATGPALDPVGRGGELRATTGEALEHHFPRATTTTATSVGGEVGAASSGDGVGEQPDESGEGKGEGEGEGEPVQPPGRRMLTAQEAVHMSLVGRKVNVLWPDDGTWWEAKVIKLNPVTGMATLFYPAVTPQPPEGQQQLPADFGAGGNDELSLPTTAAAAAAAAIADSDDEAEAEAEVGAKVKAEAEAEAEAEGEIEELNLVQAATNGEVSWSPEEVERMRRELEAIAAGGPIAPADKSAVPCPHCDRRAFKYLRSLEKHVWNDHGVRLSRDELESFEQQLRAGKISGGGGGATRKPPRKERVPPELITINYDEMYDILDDPEEVKKRSAEKVKAAKAAGAVTRKAGGPTGQRATLWNAAETDVCHVCGEADPDFWSVEGDLIVMCDGCDEQVHLSCYGLTEVPEGDAPWFCQGCIDGAKPGPGRGADGSMCALCPVPGGVVARVQPPSRWPVEWGAAGTHAHLCCANNLPEVAVTPSLTCAPIVDMSRVKNSRMSLQCGLCGVPGGCVQCSMKNCFQGFHPLCARAAGTERLYVSTDQDVPAVFFCAEHSAPLFAQRRLKAAGLAAPTGAAANALGAAQQQQQQQQGSMVPGGGGEGGSGAGAVDNDGRMAANAAMKVEAREVEIRKATFVIRLWHRFVPFLPQPADPAKKADLLCRSGRFAQRVMDRAKIPADEAARLAALTDAEGEAKVRQTHDEAAEKAMAEAKEGQHLNAGLRTYQREGVAWLAAQHAAGAGGGILGDDMGLGKTLQVLSFLQYLRDAKGESGPHLVVCPLSVLPTWVAETRRWCPSLRAVAFHGPEAERNRLKEEVLVQGTFDVLVTTYEMLTAEQSMLAARFHFRYLVLDEAQRVKNDTSLVSQAVRRVRTASALLLTGTPLQNNLHELRALVSVLFQDVLEAAGAEKMDAEGDAAFGDDTAVAAARSLLQPLMLRRTKAAVLSADLPPKTETVVRIPLSESQREWYKTLLEGEKGLFGRLATSNATSEKEALDSGRCIAEQSELITNGNGGDASAGDDGAGGDTKGGGGGDGGGNQYFTKLNNLLMQLRKVCCHPFLFGEDIAAAATAKHGGDRVEALIASSGKLAALDEMLPRFRAGGHKVLIFSQFTMMLDMLEEFCEARGHAHLRLDGSTSLARRRYETALFNKPDGRHFVYLCSTRAGGLGINLQSADTVILVDPDWNPTYDQQAQDRAHRLGQKRPVTVIRMCHANSVEEGILAVAARKASLAAAVLAGLEAGADIEALDAANAASGVDPAASAKLSFSELREIILAGAGAAEAPKLAAAQPAAGAGNTGARGGKATRGRSSSGAGGASGSGSGGGGGGIGTSAQDDGAAALARAAEGSGKRGHYTWEGVDYTEIKAQNERRNIADFWVEQLGSKRRERVATVEMVDAGEGLGMQAVSKVSLMEAREAEDRERRAAAARQVARLRAADRAARHERTCCGCGGGVDGCTRPPPAFLAPDVAAERLRCRNCPRVMSLGCARLVTRPRMGWQCPQHHCRSCNRTSSEAGGLMFRCVDCPTAFCAECNGEAPFDAVESNPEWEEMGFYLPKSFEYVRCTDCCKVKLEKEEKAEAEKKSAAAAAAEKQAAKDKEKASKAQEAAAKGKGKATGRAAPTPAPTRGGAGKTAPAGSVSAKKGAANKKRKR